MRLNPKRKCLCSILILTIVLAGCSTEKSLLSVAEVIETTIAQATASTTESEITTLPTTVPVETTIVAESVEIHAPATEPPTTTPPITAPTETNPPETVPPTTEPPTTAPPVTEPPATEPPAPPAAESAPTTPPVTEPVETVPPETVPPTTEPSTTAPPATEPPAAEASVFPATESAPTTPSPTEPEETGPTETEPPEETKPTAPTEEFKREVAHYAAYYINQYRTASGISACTVLPRMTQVAEYRADQLLNNYSHDTEDKREALAYYQYGRWVDATIVGLDPSQSYYEADTTEAICAGFEGKTAEEMGKRVADMCRNSSNHWSYIGNSKNLYIGIGVEYRAGSAYGWYGCIMVGRTNYG